MEHELEDVLESAYPPHLRTGVDGLQQLLAEYYDDHEEDPEAVGIAVKIFDFLHAFLPEIPDFANNAGFFNRDLAVLLDQQAAAALGEASAFENPNARAQSEREAQRLRTRARELMERSWAAYQNASRLAPEDARIQNDTGLIMAYYLRTDAKAAERYFLRAIELAEAQLADEQVLAEMSDARREDLPVAYGDACQNLGVLGLTLTHDPQTALGWFEKALSIGPVERPDVTEAWIPACRRAIAGDSDALEVVRREVWLHRDR
jgi:hypothetical protein